MEHIEAETGFAYSCRLSNARPSHQSALPSFRQMRGSRTYRHIIVFTTQQQGILQPVHVRRSEQRDFFFFLPLGQHSILQRCPPPLPYQQRHPCMTEESQFAVDSLEGADGVVIKWRGEMLLLLCDHLAVGGMGRAAGSLHLHNRKKVDSIKNH